MPAEARSSVRRRVLATVASDARFRRARVLTWKATAAYLAASLAATGVAYASSVALPGQPLYAVKLAVEEVAIAAAPSAGLKGSMQERVAVRRADEIAVLAHERADQPEVSEAVGRFEEAATRALSGADTPKAKRAEEKLRKHVDKVPGAAKGRAKRALDTARSGASAGKKKAEAATKARSKSPRSTKRGAVQGLGASEVRGASKK